MNAGQQGATVAMVVFNELELPQRLGEIEAFTGHRAHVHLQILFACRFTILSAEFYAFEMVFDIEVIVVFPPCTRRVLYGLLLETRIGQKALLNG